MPADIVIRPARPSDLPAVGRLAAQLVEYHRALDPRRFMEIRDAAAGYARFLGNQLADPSSVVLVAVREPASDVLGYSYGAVEGRDWHALLDPHGSIHDVCVDPEARRQGVARQLLQAMCTRLEALGAPRILLHTAVQNVEAQALFAQLGFRSTMIEMTREAGVEPDAR